jgi:chlorite dismutase
MNRSENDPLFVSFLAGSIGQWKIDRISTVIGEGLEAAERLRVIEGSQVPDTTNSGWLLLGSTSNTRYSTRAEVDEMKAKQASLGREETTRAALIPIRKSAAWWELAQDERRAIFEDHSRHISIGVEYVPAIARRLHHCRELRGPFDFLTWFEYAPQYADVFEKLVHRLRATKEWDYVDREVDIRLSRR